MANPAPQTPGITFSSNLTKHGEQSVKSGSSGGGDKGKGSSSKGESTPKDELSRSNSSSARRRKMASGLDCNPFSGTLWDRREGL
jgi:hypothetical protein